VSRASLIRLLLASALGALIGGIWSSVDAGEMWGADLLAGVLVLAAYITAWRLGDDL